MRQVICIRWGEKYGPDYVNRLHAMVARHLPGPFRFICFTDDPSGLARGRGAHAPARPRLRPAHAHPRHLGQVAALGLRLGGLSGPVLFLDLDVVVLSDLSGFFEHGEPSDVILARNPNTPFEKLGQTSIFRMPVGALAPLREAFLADPQGTADRYRFEQRFVSRTAPGRREVLAPRLGGGVQVALRAAVPAQLRPRAAPARAKVVLFPGPLNPPDAIAGRWRAEVSTSRAARPPARARPTDGASRPAASTCATSSGPAPGSPRRGASDRARWRGPRPRRDPRRGSALGPAATVPSGPWGEAGATRVATPQRRTRADAWSFPAGSARGRPPWPASAANG